jgi:hypothetical protein
MDVGMAKRVLRESEMANWVIGELAYGVSIIYK